MSSESFKQTIRRSVKGRMGKMRRLSMGPGKLGSPLECDTKPKDEYSKFSFDIAAIPSASKAVESPSPILVSPKAGLRISPSIVKTRSCSFDSSFERLAENEELPKVRLTPLPEGSRITSTKEMLSSPTGQQMPKKSGFLKKQGGTIKTWNLRWFILKGDQLHYYKDMDGKFIASIPLAGNHVITHPIKSNDTNKFVFEISAGGEGQKISSNHESYVLSANTQADMEEWVKLIRRVILSPLGGGVFGQHLEETLRHDRGMDSSDYDASSSRMSNSMVYALRQIPLIVENCVEFIRNNEGLKEEGLFRLPGHANEVKDLQDAYDMGERPIFPKTTDVHTVASLLKGFLRELPEPIIPFKRYEALIGWSKHSFATKKESPVNQNEITMTVLKEQLNLLPQPNFHLLRYLCRFLDEVQQQSNVNKMDISNLAMVFGPNVMRSKKNDAITMMSDANLVQHVIFQFIANHKLFFPEDQSCNLPIASTICSLPDVALDAAGKFTDHILDTGIGNFASGVSTVGTLDLRHRTDGLGTGLMGPISDTTKQNTPIASSNSILHHKPIKPMRRKLSDQCVLKKNEIIAPNSNALQRNSMYDNVTVSSKRSSDASQSSISQSHDCSYENEQSKHRNDFLSLIKSSFDEESNFTNNHSTVQRLSSETQRSSTNAITVKKDNQEYFASTASQSSAIKSESDHKVITESIPSNSRCIHSITGNKDGYWNEISCGTGSKTKYCDPSVVSKQLATNTINKQASSVSCTNIPTVPSRPHRKIKKDGNSSSDHEVRSEVISAISLDPIPTSREIKPVTHAPVAPTNAVYGSILTYSELEEQIITLQEELRKQRIIGSTSADIHTPVFMNETSNQSRPLDELDEEQYCFNSQLDCRRDSVNSQWDLRYKEEVKRHAMTKIMLRNAERGLKQAEHRNMELQKEMEEFFHTMGRI